MAAPLLFSIGRDSAGKAMELELASLPHLFISYSHDEQLPEMFMAILKALAANNQPFGVALSLGHSMTEQLLPTLPDSVPLLDGSRVSMGEAPVVPVAGFVRALKQELNNRRRQGLKLKAQQASWQPLVVFIDNVFDIITAAPKSTALSFIELLINAPACNMFFIVGSSGIYRNLLQQLIHITPSLQQKLRQQHRDTSLPLAAELFINPDGLLFYRAKGMMELTRLFPLEQ